MGNFGLDQAAMTKPLFDGTFCAFSAYDAAALAELVEIVGKPGCRVAEVGSWQGNGSTQILLRELSR